MTTAEKNEIIYKHSKVIVQAAQDMFAELSNILEAEGNSNEQHNHVFLEFISNTMSEYVDRIKGCI